MSAGEIVVVSADGTGIHVMHTGKGRPIVVLHGGMQSAARWDDVASRLAGRWRILAIERRVYGRSGPPRSPHSVGREVDDVAAVLEALGEPALLLGHSSGGMVALEAALRLGPRLTGLVLYEPPVLATGLHGAAHERVEAAMAADDRDEALRVFFTDIVVLPEQAVTYMRKSPEFADGWGEMKRLAPAQLEDNRAIRGLPRDLTRYAAINTPTLLLKGDQSPQHLQVGIDTLAQIIPLSEVETFVGHGHGANLDAPAEMAAAIDHFAARVYGTMAPAVAPS